MSDQKKQVLNTNDHFYEAMRNGDYPAMESLWSNAGEVAVIHPGWPPLHGRAAVLDSWRRILEGVSTRNIACSNVRCYVMENSAFVVCSEQFPEGELVATNIFVREHGVWKIVHHQGGPLQTAMDDEAAERLH